MLRKMEVAALAVLAITASASAQQRDPARPQPSTTIQTPGQTQSSQQQIDSHVANCLVLGNSEEIALCRFAIEKCDDSKVKELAQTMIDDHQKFVDKLRKYASKDQSFELRAGSEGKSKIRQVGGTDADNPNAPRTSTPAAGANTTTATRPGAANDNLSNRLFAIEHRAAEECLKLTQECLSKYEGKEFDQAFLGQQVGMHIGMLAKMKAAESSVSPEFQQLLRDGQKTAKEHREHAEKLMEKLASK